MQRRSRAGSCNIGSRDSIALGSCGVDCDNDSTASDCHENELAALLEGIVAVSGMAAVSER